MPWCDPCSRFHTTAAASEGSDTPLNCPTCGAPFGAEMEANEGISAPWHFWLLLAGVVGYLGWRLVQGLLWLVGL